MGVGGDVEVRVVRRGGDEGVDVRECPVTRGDLGWEWYTGTYSCHRGAASRGPQFASTVERGE